MTDWSNVHLIFCEGPHDAAFLNRLLKELLGFQKAKIKISELPYPLGAVLQQSFKNRAAEDLRLDLAKKFFLPDYFLLREGVLVLVFNYGGSSLRHTVPEFLADVFLLLQTAAFSGGPQVPLSYVIYADADVAGSQRVRRSISTDLKLIGDQAWLKPDWNEIPENSAAAEQNTDQGPVATYVWHRKDSDNGTLENVVQECLSDHEIFTETLKFVDQTFDWTPPVDAKREELCALNAKRLKAAFCINGQREIPGGSLSVILDKSDLLTSERLAASASVQRCVTFLRRWLGVEAETIAAGTKD